jgi:two-component system, NarL family, nitrate/nitrite response regulator NarL
MSILLVTRDKELEERCRRAASADYSIEVAASADALFARLTDTKPEVVLLDSALLSTPMETEVARIVLQADAGRVIVLTAQFNEDEEVALLRCGVKGCCRRGVDPESLRQVLSVTQSGVWITRSLLPRLVTELRRYAQIPVAADSAPADKSAPPQVNSVLPTQSTGTSAHGMLSRLPPDKLATLTRRELDIVKRIAEGATNKEVGVDLDISERTVKGHLSNIFLKLGVPDRMKLMLYINDERQQSPTGARK